MYEYFISILISLLVGASISFFNSSIYSTNQTIGLMLFALAAGIGVGAFIHHMSKL